MALARALVKQPAVLLLDEPLGALDLKLRKNMQFELKALQRDVGITFIYVTHDQEEAITMADRIAVMNEGQMLQIGTPKEIYEYPATRFIADFIGETNFIDGTLIEREADGRAKVKLPDESVITAHVSKTLASQSGLVTVAIRPERIRIGRRDAAIDRTDADQTALDALLVDNQYIGTDTRYTLRIGDAIELVARRQNLDGRDGGAFRIGQPVKAFWPISSAMILDR